MKGLEEFDSGGIWLSIKHFSICQESKKPRDGFKPIEVTNPKTGEQITKYYKPYKAVEAIVNKIEWYDREYNGTRFSGWKLLLDANGTDCILDIPFDSRACKRFMKVAEQLDFRKPIRFSAWHDKKTDSTAFNVQQDGVSVPQKYTREEPNGLPEPVQGFRGKWDYSAQEEFLYKRMTDVVIPTVEVAASLRPMREGKASGELKDDGDEPTRPPIDDDEDIPF